MQQRPTIQAWEIDLAHPEVLRHRRVYKSKKAYTFSSFVRCVFSIRSLIDKAEMPEAFSKECHWSASVMGEQLKRHCGPDWLIGWMQMPPTVFPTDDGSVEAVTEYVLGSWHACFYTEASV